MRRTEKRAEGRPSLGGVDIIDLFDEMCPELEQLAAIAELLLSRKGELDERALAGVALLIKGVHGRCRGVLDAAMARERAPRR